MFRYSIITILFFPAFLMAQDRPPDFPFPIFRGQTFTVPAGYDTLWILKHNQYKNAIKKAEMLNIADSTNTLLRLKNEKLFQIISAKDSLIALNRLGYLHYRNLWDKTDRELEKAEIKNLGKWRAAFTGFMMGSVLTGAVCLILVNL
ncbi:MAG: hypothetical protein P8184_04710 [Calditrichia bacterium]